MIYVGTHDPVLNLGFMDIATTTLQFVISYVDQVSEEQTQASVELQSLSDFYKSEQITCLTGHCMMDVCNC
jgi:hypothetical protein